MSHTITIHPPRMFESSPFLICVAPEHFSSKEHDLSILAATEREQYVAIDPRRRAHWMLGRFAAKQAVQELYKQKFQELSPESILITSRRGEAPKCHIARHALMHADPLEPTPEILISISHVGHTAVAAAASPDTHRGVGVDIDALRIFDLATARGFMSEREYEAYRACAPDDRRFLGSLIWSLKEAYLKALGTSLRTNMRGMTVRFLSEQGTGTILDNDKETGARAIWSKLDDKTLMVHMLI